jgi:hypothetical protein
LTFEYATRNATAIEPSIDGRPPPGMQLGHYPPRGTLTLAYVCPGPHTLKITALGDGGLSVSSSVGFDKTNRLTSRTAEEIVSSQ